MMRQECSCAPADAIAVPFIELLKGSLHNMYVGDRRYGRRLWGWDPALFNGAPRTQIHALLAALSTATWDPSPPPSQSFSPARMNTRYPLREQSIIRLAFTKEYSSTAHLARDALAAIVGASRPTAELATSLSSAPLERRSSSPEDWLAFLLDELLRFSHGLPFWFGALSLPLSPSAPTLPNTTTSRSQFDKRVPVVALVPRILRPQAAPEPSKSCVQESPLPGDETVELPYAQLEQLDSTFWFFDVNVRVEYAASAPLPDADRGPASGGRASGSLTRRATRESVNVVGMVRDFSSASELEGYITKRYRIVRSINPREDAVPGRSVAETEGHALPVRLVHVGKWMLLAIDTKTGVACEVKADVPKEWASVPKHRSSPNHKDFDAERSLVVWHAGNRGSSEGSSNSSERLSSMWEQGQWILHPPPIAGRRADEAEARNTTKLAVRVDNVDVSGCVYGHRPIAGGDRTHDGEQRARVWVHVHERG